MKTKFIIVFLAIFSIFYSQDYFGTTTVGELWFNRPTDVNVSPINGDVYVTGFIGGNLTGSFPITFEGGNNDGVLIKFNNQGVMQYIKQFGGFSDDIVSAMTTDDAGNIYITGYFQGGGNSNDFDADPGPGTYTLSQYSNFLSRDCFIIKLDPNGDFIWAKQISNPAGATNEDSFAIKLDSSNNIYVVGAYLWADFNPDATAEAIHLSPTETIDGFILKLDNDGNYIWSKYLSGNGSGDIVKDLYIDDNDNLYITGSFFVEIDLDPSASNAVFNTPNGATAFSSFFAKYDSDGNYLFGQALSNISGVFADQIQVLNNTIVVSGDFRGNVDLDPSSSSTANYTSSGASDSFIAKYNNSDGSFINALVFGGNSTEFEEVSHVEIYNDQLLIAGNFAETINPSSNTFTSTGSTDNYYFILNEDLTIDKSYIVGGTNTEGNAFMAPLADNKFLGTGFFRGSVDFDPSTNEDVYTTTSQRAIYATVFSFDNLGIDEITNQNVLQVYPIPTQRFLHINTDKALKEVKIYNSIGALVKHSNNIINNTIDIQDLYKGTYIMQMIDDNNNVEVRKIIKD